MSNPAPTIDLDAAADILSDYPIVAAGYLFGSAARGTMNFNSDVDFGLLLNDPKATALDHYLTLGEIAGRLEGPAGGRTVDVVVLDPQGWILRYAVISEGRLFYEADRARRVAFEAETLVRYFDFKPTYDLVSRDYLKNLRRAIARDLGR